MKLPSFNKKEKQAFFLALLLRDEKVSAVIIEEQLGKMHIIGQHEELLATPLEDMSLDAWLNVLDRTISKAEETLPPERETHSTVFGIKDDWVEEKKIKKDYLLKLKKVSESLDLTPIGFLVISEAVTHLIQDEEGVPVSGIFVDIGQKAVSVHLMKGGKTLESKSGAFHTSIPHTVDTLLQHFTSVEVLPARILLFQSGLASGDAEQADHLAQSFITHHWSKSLPFLHVPQISILPAGFDGRAVVRGAASQMGFEVEGFTGLGDAKIKTYDTDDDIEKPAPVKATKKIKEEKKVVSEEAEEQKSAKEDLDEETDESATISDDDFGFMVNRDVATDEKARVVQPVLDDDVYIPPSKRATLIVDHTDQAKEPVALAEEFDKEERSPRVSLATRMRSVLPAISLAKLPRAFPKRGFGFPGVLRRKPNKLLLIPLVLVLLLGTGSLVYASTKRATVTVYLQPRNVTESTPVTFSTESGNDFAESVIAAETVEAELEGTLSADATGKKEVGESAKGTVTLFNNASAKREVPAGTTITGNDKAFTLDKDVTVGPAAGDIFSGTKPGTAQVAVTAEEIGSEYNLPSGTKFSVGSSTTLAARNEAAFAGGSKKEVTVVAKKDIDKLLVDLPKSLEDKARDSLSQKVDGTQKLLPFLSSSAVTKQSFDKKADEEAKKVTLEGLVTYTALVYNEKDIRDFALVTLKKKYSDDLKVTQKDVSYAVRDEKETEDGGVTAELTIEAGLVPELNQSMIKNQIKGKSVAEATQQLRKMAQVARTDIVFSPSLPLLPQSLPSSDDRVEVVVKLNE